MGFSQSFPERRVEVCGIMFRCFNVHVQTCSSFITSKRCREDSLNLLMSFPTTTTKKTNQGITFGLWLQGFAHLYSWFLCKWDKNTALEGKIHLFKECMLKLLREIVEAPSVIPSLYHSCLCFTFHVVTCKKAECNLPCFLFLAYPIMLQWCFDNQWNSTLNSSSCLLVEKLESHLDWTCFVFS